MMAIRTLEGLRVLVVEDEMLVAMAIEEMLERFGCTVVGVEARVRRALEFASRESVDAAVLDVNLAGEKVFPVAEALARRGVPFVFSTGYGAAGVDADFPGAPVLQKPYPEEALARALAEAVGRTAQ